MMNAPIKVATDHVRIKDISEVAPPSHLLREYPASPAAVVVSVRADDGPAWQRGLTAADEVTIDLDVETARRLTITVDFAAGGMGCPVRFDHAVFEK